jgi:hypothetical protein
MKRSPTRARLLGAFLVLVPLLGLGCRGRGVPPPADPEQARHALRTALDAWRQGETPGALQQRSPPIHVNDSDWHAGLRLKRYELKGPEGHHGSQFRCSVLLSLQNEKGQAVDRTVNYLVDTHPALVIVRDNF